MVFHVWAGSSAFDDRVHRGGTGRAVRLRRRTRLRGRPGRGGQPGSTRARAALRHRPRPAARRQGPVPDRRTGRGPLVPAVGQLGAPGPLRAHPGRVRRRGRSRAERRRRAARPAGAGRGQRARPWGAHDPADRLAGQRPQAAARAARSPGGTARVVRRRRLPAGARSEGGPGRLPRHDHAARAGRHLADRSSALRRQGPVRAAARRPRRPPPQLRPDDGPAAGHRGRRRRHPSRVHRRGRPASCGQHGGPSDRPRGRPDQSRRAAGAAGPPQAVLRPA